MTNLNQSLLLTAISPTKVSHSCPNLIRCEVVFGAPRLNCNGTGICKIMNSTANPAKNPKPDCRRNSAYASSHDGTDFSLIFYRELVCLNVYKNHLRKGVLEITEPCPLPKFIIRQLGLTSKVLACGKYPVEETNGVFRINLKLQIVPEIIDYHPILWF